MTPYTICFTGHRTPSDNLKSKIANELYKTLIFYISQGYRYFGTGGALGFDTLAAQTILQLKRNYQHIKLILVLPCKNQDRWWSEHDKKEYRRIQQLSDKIVYISNEYTNDCMLKRNRHLVNNSSLCICYCIKKSGGTAYTLKVCKTKEITN